MRRSVGVTVIAILSLLGSLFLVAMTILTTLSVMFVAPREIARTNPGAEVLAARPLMILVAAIYLAPAVWGIASGIGLLRLKNWARISTIVFGVLLCLFGIFGALSAAMLPALMSNAQAQVPNAPQIKTVVALFMGLFSLAQVAIGLWWSVYLTRRHVAAQFARAGTAAVYEARQAPDAVAPAALQGRPLSISVIAWFLLIGAAFYPLVFVLHTPLLFFGALVTGSTAVLIITGYLAVHLYVGIGLLKLWPEARVTAIVYCLFSIVNVAVTWLRPGAGELMQRVMAAQPKIFGSVPQVSYPEPFFKLVALGTAVVFLVPVYFLVTAGTAFQKEVELSRVP